MKPIIKHISFLDEHGERVVIRCSPNGSFTGYEYKKDREGRYKKMAIRLTAREFIYKDEVINSDPVLTLIDGNKVRVFTGGDSSYLPASVDGLLERHDKRELVKRKLEEAKRKRSESMKKKSDTTDEYDNPFNWFGVNHDTD